LGSNHWGLALSPDGRWLATGNTAGKLTIWDWSTRREATNFAMNAEWFGLLRFSRSGNFLFATVVDNAYDGRTRIWRTGQWQEVTPATMRSANIWSAALSPDDRTLAVGYGDGSIKLIDFPNGEQRNVPINHQGPVTGLLFTPDGRKLISSSLDRSTRIWDVSAGRESATLHGLVGFAIALTPDGRRLATGGELPESAVKLWNPVTGREVLSLPGRGEFFGQVVFSPDGSLLAAISLSGIANLWRAPPWEEIEAAEQGTAGP
jgi:WD40 repeat protein